MKNFSFFRFKPYKKGDEPKVLEEYHYDGGSEGPNTTNLREIPSVRTIKVSDDLPEEKAKSLLAELFSMFHPRTDK